MSLNEESGHFLRLDDLISQGLAVADAVGVLPDKIICPAFGEPGWAPFCFLNGNPVFQAFDVFQAFIQSSIVSLHDLLQSLGIQNAYGPSIILFTIFVRIVLSPVTFKQLESTQRTQALQPKVAEIREKYTDKNLQNQMIALLYQETEVNPLAGCLPALLQIPVFLSLYRSFTNLATGADSKLNEPFLWLPSLTGPVYGARSTDWLTAGWQDNIPSLGWHDTLAFVSIPALLVLAQAISLQILTPPSDDPAIQKTQRILKYLPLMLGYFALSVPAGLGVYWVTNNLLSTGSTVAIKQYFKKNPPAFSNVDLETLADSQMSAYMNPIWGYKSEQMMVDEAKRNYRPQIKRLIPEDYIA